MSRKLNRREKYAVTLASGVIVVFLVLQLVVFPLVRHRQRVSRRIEAQTAALAEMQALQIEYEALQKKMRRLDARLTARNPEFSLFTFVEALAGRTGVKPHIAYMKPSTGRQRNGDHEVSQVEMQLKDIDLDQLVSYLYGIESAAELVYVNRLSISQSSKTSGKIDVVLQVETIES
jgi:general secretion pathway protein M